MKPAKIGPLGGEGKIVEADESVFGGHAKNRAFRKKPPRKDIVLTLLECFYDLCKRVVFCTHHAISEAHLHCYLVE